MTTYLKRMTPEFFCPKRHMFCAIDPFQCCKVLLVGKIQNTYASYAAILMYFYVSCM